MESYIFEKVNNSIATKMCANLLNNRLFYFISALQISMNKFSSVIFKCENKLKRV